MATQAEIKRLVIADRKSKNSPARLFIAEYEGELYATNSYWLTPAASVAPLLDHYNLPADKPGAFEVNGQVRPLEMDTPNLGGIMPAKMGVDLPTIERARVGDESSASAYQRAGTGGYLAMFKTDGGLVAVNADFLHWITNDGDVGRIACGYGYRMGELVYRQRTVGGPVVITATRDKQVSDGHNGADGKWKPAVWKKDGEHFLGLLMPVRI